MIFLTLVVYMIQMMMGVQNVAEVVRAVWICTVSVFGCGEAWQIEVVWASGA